MIPRFPFSPVLAGLLAVFAGGASHPVSAGDEAPGLRTAQRKADRAATGVRADASVTLADLRQLMNDERYVEAATSARTLLPEIEARLGPESREAADVRDILVQALVRTQKTRDAEVTALAERAVAMRERAARPDSAAMGRSLWALGATRVLAADYAAAETILERALLVQERSLGPEHPDLIETLQTRAKLLLDTDRVNEARVAADRAVTIVERSFGPEDRRLAPILRTLASILRMQEDFDGALSARRRALKICEKAYGIDHVQTALAMNTYARSLRAIGEDDSANALDRRALDAFTKTEGPESSFHLYPSFDLCGGLINIGDYAGARPHCERAVTLLESARGPDHPEVFVGLASLARLELAVGNFAKARAIYERCVTGLERAFGPEHSKVAFAIEKLGHAEIADGRLEAARSHMERAVAIREKTYGPDHEALTESLYGLAAVLRKMGDAAGSVRVAERALAIVEQKRGTDQPLTLPALHSLALALSEAGSHRRSEALFRRAVALHESLYGPRDPQLASLLVDCATLLARRGQGIEAFDLALRAEEIAAGHLAAVAGGVDETEAVRFEAVRTSGLDLALAQLADDPSPERARRAWDRALRSRALVLDEMASRHLAVRNAGHPDLASLAAAVAGARQRLANLAVRDPGSLPPDLHARRLDEARREKERCERALAARSASFRSELSGRTTGLSEVAAALPQRSACLGFFHYLRPARLQGPPGKGGPAAEAGAVPSCIAFLLRSGDAAPSVFPLGPAAVIDAAIADWNARVLESAHADRAARRDHESSCRRTGAVVRAALWDTVSPLLADVDRVFIVPDGMINAVSFASLPDDHGMYLVETGPTLHYLSSERDMSLPEPGTVGRGLLVMGGADYDYRSLSASISEVRKNLAHGIGLALASAGSVFRGRRSDCPDFASLRFPPLPGTDSEMHTVAGIWSMATARSADDSGSVLRMTGGRASEGAFKRDAPGRRVIHLATHGFFLGEGCLAGEDANPLINSGLAMAGANRRDSVDPDEEDGILTAEEVAAMDLAGVEWVVLSGCETGTGSIKAGEGVFGLRRAFQVAGARTLITSLWPAEDRATRAWMKALYEGRFVHGLSTADAARQASRTVLRDLRAKGQDTLPILWGGFVAAGAWK